MRKSFPHFTFYLILSSSAGHKPSTYPWPLQPTWQDRAEQPRYQEYNRLPSALQCQQAGIVSSQNVQRTTSPTDPAFCSSCHSSFRCRPSILLHMAHLALRLYPVPSAGFRSWGWRFIRYVPITYMLLLWNLQWSRGNITFEAKTKMLKMFYISIFFTCFSSYILAAFVQSNSCLFDFSSYN